MTEREKPHPLPLMHQENAVQTPAAIAVVDDDASVRRSLMNLFDSLGFAVSAFGSAEDFLSSDQSTTGCIVLDVQLPGMSGLELLERLSRSSAPIGVVMLTAHGDQSTRRRAAELGVAAFLAKPVRSDELVSSVKRRLASEARPAS